MGAILAVPRDGEFYKQIELGLSAISARQRKHAGLMIWGALYCPKNCPYAKRIAGLPIATGWCAARLFCRARPKAWRFK